MNRNILACLTITHKKSTDDHENPVGVCHAARGGKALESVLASFLLINAGIPLECFE